MPTIESQEIAGVLSPRFLCPYNPILRIANRIANKVEQLSIINACIPPPVLVLYIFQQANLVLKCRLGSLCVQIVLHQVG